MNYSNLFYFVKLLKDQSRILNHNAKLFAFKTFNNFSSFSYHGGTGEFGEEGVDGCTRTLASFKGGTPFVYSRQG